MSPVGPRSTGVYWLRRAAVVAVILTVVLGARTLLSGGGAVAAPDPSTSSSPDASGTSSAPETTEGPSVDESASSNPEASALASGGASASATPTSSTVPACEPSDIAVTASTDSKSYTTGSTPKLKMRIENVSSQECTRELGADRNELIITMGTTRIWSSDDCNVGGTPKNATLKPGQSYSVTVTWLGRLSAKGCPDNAPMATKGSYRLVGRNVTVTSDSTAFSLT
ncbi:unannotated protein [freshwater metagenome]|uniref:Unannotated protein n=1 Tax=freshwater metagenome TaxID=449393 RepID=A0A6J7JUW2_9ZZZZ